MRRGCRVCWVGVGVLLLRYVSLEREGGEFEGPLTSCGCCDGGGG